LFVSIGKGWFAFVALFQITAGCHLVRRKPIILVSPLLFYILLNVLESTIEKLKHGIQVTISKDII
jgi:hypothetical protein